MTGEGGKQQSKERPGGRPGVGVVLSMPKSPKVQIQKSKNGGREKPKKGRRRRGRGPDSRWFR